MYNFGSFDAFIVKPTIMPDFARNLLHYNSFLAFRGKIQSNVKKYVTPYFQIVTERTITEVILRSYLPS